MSAAFTDFNGKEWTINLTLGAAKRVQETLGVNLLNPASAEQGGVFLSQRLMTDDLFLLDIVLSIVEPQFKAAGVGVKEWIENADAATMKNIDEAFWSAYVNFFRARGQEWAAIALTTDLNQRSEAFANAIEQVRTIGLTSSDSPEEQASEPTGND